MLLELLLLLLSVISDWCERAGKLRFRLLSAERERLRESVLNSERQSIFFFAVHSLDFFFPR